jgi:hypothetical protein
VPYFTAADKSLSFVNVAPHEGHVYSVFIVMTSRGMLTRLLCVFELHQIWGQECPKVGS